VQVSLQRRPSDRRHEQDGAGCSDEVLVTRAQAGDRAALGALVRRHQRAVFALCARYIADRDEVADLVQKTFVRAMTKIGELRDATVFRAWVLRISAHLSLNHLRDQARFVSDDGAAEGDGAAAPEPAATALERLESAEASAALKVAVRSLPTKQRMTLELRIYEDLPFKEIGQALEISEGAAKVNFHYAVRKLRGLLGPQGDGTKPATPRPRQ
jgi:RNA polymerase sigma-70 factor (ECF subfamily)